MGAAKVPTNRRRPDLQFQDLAEHSPVGMAIVQDGRFLYVNPKYCEIFGYGRDELLLRMTPLDLVADADRPRAAESMRTRPRGAPPTVAVEFRGKRKDGSSIDLEFHVADMEIGGRPALIASAVDVTDRKRAAERMHAADGNFLTIFNSVGDAIFVSDATTGKFTEVNDAACTMFGYSRVELIGSDIGTLSSGRTPYTQEAALPWFEKARSGLPQLFEWHCKAKDGRLFWAEISLRCLFIKDTHVLLASLRDITERRRLDENQSLGEARFRLLFEEATDAIVVYDLDRDRITEANRKAEQLFECGRDELSRLGLRHFYTPDQPDEQPIEVTFFKYGRRAIEGAEAIFERRIRTAKGKNRICEVRLVKLPSSHGNAIRGSFIDVTDRKLAAEKIREDESQFRALAEQGMTGIFVIQNDMSLGYVNPHFTELLGFPHEEVIGRPLLDFVAEADRPGVISAVRKLISGKAASIQLGVAIARKDGGFTDLLAQGTMASFRGQPAIFGVAMDVTERKKVEERLRKSQQIIEGILNTIPVRVFWKDRNLVYLGCNAVFARDAGFVDPKDVVGKDDYQMGWRDQAELYRGDDRQVIESGRSKIFIEEPQTTPEGKTLTLLTSKLPLRGSDGKIEGVLGTYLDITAHKQAEEARRTSEEKYIGLFEATRDAIMTLEPPSWKFTSANPATVKMFGAANEAELMSRPPWEQSPERQPDGRMSAEKAKEMIGVAMREGSHFFEWTHRRMDGVSFPADVLLTRIFQGGRAILHATVRDISERKKDEQAVLRVNRALTTLSQANEVLVRATSQDGLFQEMCRVIVEAGGYRMAWIGLAENNSDKILRPVSHAGYEADYLTLAKISWADDERGSGPAGTAIRSREVQVIQDIANDTRMAPWRAEALKRGYASVIALPLQSAGSVLGVLSLYASEPNAFGAEDVSLLTELADDLSYGITALGTRDDRVAGLQRLERALEETVQAIASTVEMRDAYTAGHQRRVAVIAEAIAGEMGLSDDRIHGLRLASIVHDLGKINIPAEILNRPGKLSAIEYAFIKTHPRAGYDILKSVEFPWPVADIVLQHHERLDGSGYPSGLKGDAILLEARILTVADVVESMTSHRPYRPALGIDLALAEIQGGSGKLYDPLVVEACVKLARGGMMILDD